MLMSSRLVEAGPRSAHCPFDVLAVLDLEGKDEIIELPVLLLDVHKKQEIARFHAWIRPSFLDETSGSGLAVPFSKALQDLQSWLCSHELTMWDTCLTPS